MKIAYLFAELVDTLYLISVNWPSSCLFLFYGCNTSLEQRIQMHCTSGKNIQVVQICVFFIFPISCGQHDVSSDCHYKIEVHAHFLPLHQVIALI